jgi:triosephosphate isomerase
MRKKIIAGNWKMNKTPSEAVALINELKPLVANDDVDVLFCVPAIDLVPAVEAAKGSNIQIGAENMYFEESGAYTGEIAPNMLTDIGVKYVIIGHSERREYFAETDETVNKKVLKAFEHGITPIICCGETLTQRKQGIYLDWIRMQIKIAFQNVTADQAKTAVIAYEPIWAIGTGKSASVEIAENCCKTVRDTVRELFGDKAADEVRIQYGGSVKPNNVEEYMAQPDIDGALIGGASLKEDSFIEIIEKTK